MSNEDSLESSSLGNRESDSTGGELSGQSVGFAMHSYLAPAGWIRIGILYALGLASLASAIIGGAMAWEAITWQPTSVGDLPPMLLQFCIGAAAATAAGLLAISCLVPALVFHAERRFSPHLPDARVVRERARS